MLEDGIGMNHKELKITIAIIGTFLIIVVVGLIVAVSLPGPNANPTSDQTTDASIDTSTPQEVPTPTPTAKPVPPSLTSTIQAVVNNENLPCDEQLISADIKSGEVTVTDVVVNLQINIIDYVNTGKELIFDIEKAVWQHGNYAKVEALIYYSKSGQVSSSSIIGAMAATLDHDTELSIDWKNANPSDLWLTYDAVYINPILNNN